MEKIGAIGTPCRYPVKSMAVDETDEVFVGFAGVMGDRAYAFVPEGATFPPQRKDPLRRGSRHPRTRHHQTTATNHAEAGCDGLRVWLQAFPDISVCNMAGASSLKLGGSGNLVRPNRANSSMISSPRPTSVSR